MNRGRFSLSRMVARYLCAPMFRYILPLLLLVLSFEASAQSGTYTQNSADSQGRKQGQWSKFWPNGKMRYMGQFKDDKALGEFKHYDEDGHLVSIQHHAGDGKVSRAQHFHPNGKVMATGKYVAQVKDSTWNYFDTEGRLRKVERYANGQLHGGQEAYYSNGQMAELDNYQKGILHGEHKSWFDTGKLKSTSEIVQGEPEGKMTFYYVSGKKEIEGQMVNGDRDGAWFYYNTDGSIQLQMLYSRGEVVKERKENGVFKEYYDDGQLMSEVKYKAGKQEGPFVEYYDNGTWVLRPMQADPIMGTPQDMERVLQGQSKKREGTYRDGVLEGEVKEYDPKGKMIRTLRYNAGSLAEQ